LLRDEPVVAIHGPRAVGKSTLLRAAAAAHGVGVVDLDDPRSLDAALANPSLTTSAMRPVCIDEYQHATVLLDTLKARLNVEGSIPGTAIITGSTRQDALPLSTQALTGRLYAMSLWPLSQGEIDGVHENFLDILIEDAERLVAAQPESTTTRAEYAARVCRGGFPDALRRSGTARRRWFDAYVQQSVQRDAAELARLRQRQSLAEVLTRLAGRTAQVLNVNQIADGLEVTRTTVETYIRLLEDLYLVSRLPAWGQTLAARATPKPKIHVVDSGVAARLMRVSEERLAAGDPAANTEFGHLVETFAVGELRKQASWQEAPPMLGHWRTSTGHEVDLILELDDGRVFGFEFKAGERVSGTDLQGLREVRDRVGPRFAAGVALSLGTRSYTYDDRLHVMPLDRLWLSAASSAAG
jgi:predicted AAA+ superfamily ATPase